MFAGAKVGVRDYYLPVLNAILDYNLKNHFGWHVRSFLKKSEEKPILYVLIFPGQQIAQ